MTPTKIAGATHVFRAPKDWDSTTHGECGDLEVKMVDGMLQSAWVPSPEELAALNEGKAIILTIFAVAQPPVALGVSE